MNLAPLLWTIRVASALGFASLSLTGEIHPMYVLACWAVWCASLALDRYTRWADALRRRETAAVILLVTIFALDFFVWGYSIFVSVAHFLLLFQMFKMLGGKARKDCLQILLVSFFQVLSACTLAVDAWQGFILLLLIPVATAGLFWQQISREIEGTEQTAPPSALRSYRRWVAGMCLSAIPINALLAGAMFMIFPRLAFRGAFAGLGAGRSGYTEQVNLAQTGMIGTDSTPVMWLQILPKEDRGRWKSYLRGGTLDYFDGRRWSHGPVAAAHTIYPDSNGVFRIQPSKSRGLRQSVTLVNTAGATLFGSPNISEIIAPLSTLQYLPDGSVRWTRGWRKPLRYDVVSQEQASATPAQGYSQDLQLPSVNLQRTRVLARKIAGRRKPLAQAQALEAYLRTHYKYSLDLGSQASSDPLEDFLFDRQRGPCGHFASAMAVMLRLQGIPARVVSGYYKGSWNPMLEQYLIRERDAHAWVEAYISDRGWVAFDPSPRTTGGAMLARRWQLRLQENWEYLNYQWDRMVIQYDLYSQVKVVEDIQSNTNKVNSTVGGWIDKYLMGFKRPTDDRRLTRADRHVVFFFLLTAVVGLLWFLSRRGHRSEKDDPAIAFYQKFLTQMAHKGFPKSQSETGWEYVRRLQSFQSAADTRRSLPADAQHITDRYYRARFALPNPK
jgi:hypothetical protein